MSNIDPRTWPQERQVSLLIWGVLGALAGIVVGYWIAGARYYGFTHWLTSDSSGAWLWPLMGAAAGAAVFYLRALDPP